MRETVLKAIEIYAEGGSIEGARKAVGIRGGDFYRVMRQDPALKQLYHDTQAARADMMVDEAYTIGMDDGKNPGIARVQAEIRLKIAAFFDRPRFGDKIDMTVDQTVSVAGALEAAKQRALQPRRNLAGIADAEIIEQQQLSAPQSTDAQSGTSAIAPEAGNDPFAD